MKPKTKSRLIDAGIVAFILALLATLVVLCSSCAMTVPGVQGIDQETSTMTVDQGALTPADKEYLESLGFKIKEVDAAQEALDAKIDDTHEALKELAKQTAPDLASEYGIYAILALLLGKEGIKGSKGLIGGLIKRTSKKA